MLTKKQYLEYARDCERLAETISDPELRAKLLEMAEAWRALATDEAKAP